MATLIFIIYFSFHHAGFLNGLGNFSRSLLSIGRRDTEGGGKQGLVLQYT
jgi:hypothetical protein